MGQKFAVVAQIWQRVISTYYLVDIQPISLMVINIKIT